MTKITVSQYGLCKLHFPATSFTSIDQRNLKWNAIPISFATERETLRPTEVINNDSFSSNETNRSLANDIEHEVPTATADNLCIPLMDVCDANASISLNSACVELRNEVEDLKKEVERLRAANKMLRAENDKVITKSEETTLKIRSLQYHLRQVPKKIAQAVSEVTIDNLLKAHDPPLHKTAETMVKLQFHKPNTPYSPEEQELAKQFQFHSASAYSRMRKAGCVLPAESTVRSWISQYDIKPGFSPVIFEKLKHEMSKKDPLHRYCSLAWDEMSIKSYEEYSSKYDCIEGLVDLGPLGRSNERAHNAFFFNLTSLNADHKWRQPIAYFLSGKGGLPAEQIHLLLQECLQHLEKADVRVKLLVCDQGVHNQRLYDKILQVNYVEAVVKIGGKSYFASFDFPHLIKRVVSALRKHGGIWQDGRAIVSWSDFTAAYAFDKNLTTCHLLGHISDIHLSPNAFQAMNVKRAFQILGHRYAQAIKLWGHSSQISSGGNVASTSWKDSAEFAEKMNDIIDACNSVGLLDSNPNRRPLAPENPQIEALIIDLIEWSQTWRIPQKSGYTVLPCFRGLQLTGHALLKVYKTISQEYPCFKFVTSRGNQDGTEHWFGCLRGRNGNCPNPTARMVRLSTRHVLSMGSLHMGNHGNVHGDHDAFLMAAKPSCISSAFEDWPLLITVSHEMDMAESSDESDASEAIDIIHAVEECNDQTGSKSQDSTSVYETNAICYFAGYIASKTIKQCSACRTTMSKSPMDARSQDELYIEFREYENVDIDAPTVTKLTRPADEFAKLVGLQLQIFHQVWAKHWSSLTVLNNITADIMQSLQLSVPHWFAPDHNCFNHRVAALKFLVRVKIFSMTRINNRASLKRNIQCFSRNPKLQKVTHQ